MFETIGDTEYANLYYSLELLKIFKLMKINGDITEREMFIEKEMFDREFVDYNECASFYANNIVNIIYEKIFKGWNVQALEEGIDDGLYECIVKSLQMFEGDDIETNIDVLDINILSIKLKKKQSKFLKEIAKVIEGNCNIKAFDYDGKLYILFDESIILSLINYQLIEILYKYKSKL